ncbi:MAG: DUF98 domain-containing protein [Alcanivoracaceae bacterium]|nr:DUF98 domain-containing protein [Alcanivoracaceae bacterium]
MKNLTNFPLALQLLMRTDGTVTELIKLLTKEDIIVRKLSEKINDCQEGRILDRHIFLQGTLSGKKWLYAESKIYLDNLPEEFVTDLLEKTIPIGTLWINYRMETFKLLIDQYEEDSKKCGKNSAFNLSTFLLTRVYRVFNQKKLIMEITEKFPVAEYENLI